MPRLSTLPPTSAATLYVLFSDMFLAHYSCLLDAHPQRNKRSTLAVDETTVNRLQAHRNMERNTKRNTSKKNARAAIGSRCLVSEHKRGKNSTEKYWNRSRSSFVPSSVPWFFPSSRHLKIISFRCHASSVCFALFLHSVGQNLTVCRAPVNCRR